MSKENKKGEKVWKNWILIIVLGVVMGSFAAGLFIFLGPKDKNEEDKDAGRVMQGDLSRDTEVPEVKIDKETGKDDNVSKTMQVSSGDYSSIVESVMPSVVTVQATKESSRSGYDDLYDDIFDYDYYGSKRQYVSTSTGTGFIIGQNGNELLLATNNHVIEGAKNVRVKFIDGKEANASVKGGDENYDVAVLSIDGRELDETTIKSIKIAAIGNSDEVKVGDVAIAIGNALGYGQSVTVGYISALNVNLDLSNGKMQFIQADTAINEGNSGGPLLNIYGEVIGITTAKKFNTTKKIEGVGYAIPLAKVIPIINELINRVDLSPEEAGYLGITGKDVTERYSKAYGMPNGVYVDSVADEKSPAYIAGIHHGDIITAVNGRNIKSMEELKDVLSYIRFGTEVEVTYYSLGSSGYEEKKINVVLAKKTDLENTSN